MTQTTSNLRSAFATRPQSLREVVARSADGEEFSYLLSSFLDTFYRHVQRNERPAALAAVMDEPQLGENERHNAYVAAIAEYLARRWGLSEIPAWTDHPARFLKRPMFDQPSARSRALYLVESPAAFRRRLIFVETVPLRRASMPVTS